MIRSPWQLAQSEPHGSLRLSKHFVHIGPFRESKPACQAKQSSATNVAHLPFFSYGAHTPGPASCVGKGVGEASVVVVDPADPSSKRGLCSYSYPSETSPPRSSPQTSSSTAKLVARRPQNKGMSIERRGSKGAVRSKAFCEDPPSGTLRYTTRQSPSQSAGY